MYIIYIIYMWQVPHSTKRIILPLTIFGCFWQCHRQHINTSQKFILVSLHRQLFHILRHQNARQRQRVHINFFSSTWDTRGNAFGTNLLELYQAFFVFNSSYHYKSVVLKQERKWQICHITFLPVPEVGKISLVTRTFWLLFCLKGFSCCISAYGSHFYIN